MAAHYVAEVRGFRPHGPYHLGGSSAGGLVAFEMARQLAAAGEEVGVLALFDTWGPDYPRPVAGMSAGRVRLARLRERVDLHAGNLLAASGARAKLAYVATKAGRLKNDAVKNVSRILARVKGRLADPRPAALRRVEKGGRRAIDVYVPRPYDGPITLFRATKQPAGIAPDHALGWTRVARGGLDVIEVAGYHGAIVYEPRVGPLAARLQERLEAFASSRSWSGTP